MTTDQPAIPSIAAVSASGERPRVVQSPHDAHEALAAARRALAAGHLEAALSWCEQAVRVGAESGEVVVVVEAVTLLPNAGPGLWSLAARQRALAAEALRAVDDDPVAVGQLRAVLEHAANPWVGTAGHGGVADHSRDDRTRTPVELRGRHSELLYLGDVERRLALADEMIGLGGRDGDDDVVATGRSWRLDALSQLGRRSDLEAELLDAAGLVDRMHRPWWTWWIKAVRASLAHLEGAHVDALREGDAAAEFGLGHGIAEARFVHLVLQTWVALRTGERLAEVEAEVGALVRTAPLQARAWHAQLLAAQNRRGDVEVVWRALAPHVASVPHRAPEWAIATAGHVALALYVGDRSAAAVLLDVLRPVDGLYATGPAHTPGHGPVALHLGRLAGFLGDAASARSHLEHAVAQADAGYATDFAVDARAALAGLAGSGSGLTPRETEIAELVAQGETNRRIARTLFVSERTVESHVSSVLRKLDLPSRAAVAAWFVRKTHENH